MCPAHSENPANAGPYRWGPQVLGQASFSAQLAGCWWAADLACDFILPLLNGYTPHLASWHGTQRLAWRGPLPR